MQKKIEVLSLPLEPSYCPCLTPDSHHLTFIFKVLNYSRILFLDITRYLSFSVQVFCFRLMSSDVCQWWHTPLIPTLRRYSRRRGRQISQISEFKTSLIYRISFWTARLCREALFQNKQTNNNKFSEIIYAFKL